MSEPLVCAVMLTKDRPAMAARAVRAFRAQTYPDKMLLVWDTGDSWRELGVGADVFDRTFHVAAAPSTSIGAARNAAARWIVDGPTPYPEILIHWDDDDVSHPNRIAEQVAHLQSSGADAVGYNELLFWRDTLRVDHSRAGGSDTFVPGEAWLYKHRTNAPGTSLCFWRKTWERKPFPDLPKPGGGAGEDYHWLQRLNVATVSSVLTGLQPEPRLIASIHGGNTQSYDLEGIIERGSQEWRRAPEWDDYARKAMAL